MRFVVFHVVWFSTWIAINAEGVPGVPAFDPFPYSLLTMIVSLEAIFLSAFLLVSQNRMQELAEQRAELDLHVNLLAEREATEVLRKLTRLEAALGVEAEEDERGMRALLRETPEVEVAEPPPRKGEPGNGAKGAPRAK